MILLRLIMSLLMFSCNAESSAGYHDTTLNNKIILRNSASIESNLGNLMTKLNAGKSVPDIYFRNKSGTEYLRLSFYPGDNANVFSLFEVSGTSPHNRTWPSSFLTFTTESGIKLGLSKLNVIKKLQKNYTEKKSGDLTILRYEIDEKKDKPFLNRYNMPVYFAEFFFKKDSLEKFIFGFEYP